MVIDAKQEGSVLVLSINRPDVLNALNVTVMNDLKTALERAEADDSVKVIVITGSGNKAFAAGADISEFLNLKDAQEGAVYSCLGQTVFSYISRLPKPVICAINGYALGGGLELALACDIRFAAIEAKLGLPEIKLGLYPGYGGAQRLPRLIGKGKALYLMMSGEMISAEEGERLGFIEKILPQADLYDSVIEFAAKISAYPAEALAALKHTVTNGLEIHIDDALKADSVKIGELMISEEARKRAEQFIKA